jgi:hypothetical protein
MVLAFLPRLSVWVPPLLAGDTPKFGQVRSVLDTVIVYS